MDHLDYNSSCFEIYWDVWKEVRFSGISKIFSQVLVGLLFISSKWIFQDPILENCFASKIIKGYLELIFASIRFFATWILQIFEQKILCNFRDCQKCFGTFDFNEKIFLVETVGASILFPRLRYSKQSDMLHQVPVNVRILSLICTNWQQVNWNLLNVPSFLLDNPWNKLIFQIQVTTSLNIDRKGSKMWGLFFKKSQSFTSNQIWSSPN